MGRDALAAAGSFAFEGMPVAAEPMGAGHINDTYALACAGGDGARRRYVLQRIERRVFGNPAGLMKNIAAVTRHMRGKALLAGRDPDRRTLTIIPTDRGDDFLEDGDGECWRAYAYIEGTHSRDTAESPAQFRGAGALLGNFHATLSDFPIASLYETIPAFHDTKLRYGQFLNAVGRDAANRARGAAAEIGFLSARGGDSSVLADLIAEGRLPLRATHNDTKFGNILIDDATGECLCLIDLDTVMAGLCLYDFGDSIRTGASTGLEDERDLSKVSMDLGLFESFARGYLEAAGGILTRLERELLPFSAWLMTLESGLRFLTDHLNGDTYFKVHRPGHNLDRARTQIKLLADMERKADEMRKAVGEA